MPTNVVKTKRDEEKWQRAKEIATKSGKEDNYAYIMGIYKKMKPDHKFNKVASVILRASSQGNGQKIFSKIAAVQQKSTAGQDFAGGLDPTGSYTSSYGLSNQARGASEAEHAKSKSLAQVGGLIGSGVGLPFLTSGVMGGVQGAARAKGGIASKAMGGISGFAKGVASLPKDISAGLRLRSAAKRRLAGGSSFLNSKERAALKHLGGKATIGDVMGGRKGMSATDAANLMINRMTRNSAKRIKREANTGLAMAGGAMGIGGAIGSYGAGAQYEKGRQAYKDSVNFDRQRGLE